MSKPPLTITCDVDGCILNFSDTISDFMTQHYGLSLQDHSVNSQRQYGLFERFHLQDIDALGGFDRIKHDFEQHGHWAHLRPMNHIEDWSPLLDSPDLDIHFVTSLPPHLHLERHANLEEVFSRSIDPQRIHCVPLGQSKKPWIERLQPEVFIEDNLTNLQDCDHDRHLSLWIDHQEECYQDHPIADHVIRLSHLNDAASVIYAYRQHRDPSRVVTARSSWNPRPRRHALK